MKNCVYFPISYISHLDSGPLILRRLCALLGAESVYLAICQLLVKDDRLESIALIVETLNLLLLTTSELYELRQAIQECLQSTKGCQLFQTLFQSWCHNPVASLTLCLLAQYYDLGAALIVQL